MHKLIEQIFGFHFIKRIVKKKINIMKTNVQKKPD